jgi:hypothetical protein
LPRSSLEVADIFRDHGAAWRAANAGHVSLAQLKVMETIKEGTTVFRLDEAGNRQAWTSSRADSGFSGLLELGSVYQEFHALPEEERTPEALARIRDHGHAGSGCPSGVLMALANAMASGASAQAGTLP